jgi:hypothetical protein
MSYVHTFYKMNTFYGGCGCLSTLSIFNTTIRYTVLAYIIKNKEFENILLYSEESVLLSIFHADVILYL